MNRIKDLYTSTTNSIYLPEDKSNIDNEDKKTIEILDQTNEYIS